MNEGAFRSFFFDYLFVPAKPKIFFTRDNQNTNAKTDERWKQAVLVEFSVKGEEDEEGEEGHPSDSGHGARRDVPCA
jgi:hypothetical protein